MTDIKMPPMPEPDHYAFVDGGQGIWVEGGPTGTPFYSEQQVQELMREAVRLNAQAVPDTREMFNAGWCAAARFCDREDVVYDGLVGPGGCPAFEVAYRAAFTALSAAPAAPQPAQPLTDVQINAGWRALPYDIEDKPEPWAFKEGVRFAERKHGVGGKA